MTKNLIIKVKTSSPSDFSMIYRVSLVLSGIAVVALLTWGTYSVLLIQTSPSDQAAIISEASKGFIRATLGFPNGTTVPPGATREYIIFLKTNIPPEIAPNAYLLPNGKGAAEGPLEWTAPTSNDTSYDKNYVIFTYTFCSSSTCQGGFGRGTYGTIWLSDPLGNITQPMETVSTGGGGPTGGDGVETAIAETVTPGNYTLHYANTSNANFSARVVFAQSHIWFSRSRPYLYAGALTLALGAAVLCSIVVVSVTSLRQSRRKP